MSRPYHLFMKALEEAQSRRNYLPGILAEEPTWSIYEALTLLYWVNWLREREGRAPMTIEAVQRKESLARGHIDYTQKWAIGCEELVNEA